VKVEGLLKELRDNKTFAKKFLLGISGAIFGIIITYIYYPKISYRIGIISTPSIYEKIVVYELKNVDRVKKDKLYVFTFPKDTPYYKKGEVFIKYAKCVEGDKLEVKGLNYYCNGKLIGKAKTHDSKGKKVKNFTYNGIIPKDKVFMYAPHKDSYDSRYWGFLDKEKIIGEGKWQILKW